MSNQSKRIDDRFLILGDEKRIQKYSSERMLKKIVRRDQRSKIPAVWGTLGWRDNRKFDLEVQYSQNGNTNNNKRDQSTLNVVKNIKRFNKDIKNEKNDILERYINFDVSDFKIDWEAMTSYKDIPELRLDIFVKDKEGAMVYLYHQQKENFGLKNDKAVFEEFVQCQKTDDNYTTKRDRLSYYFKVLPPTDYSVNDDGMLEWGNDERKTSFILKIITFKRKTGTPKELLHDFFSAESLNMMAASKGGSATYSLFGQKKYGLLVYDGSVKSSSVASSNNDRFDMRGAFFNVDGDHPIDRNKKTLLLIHGTFSSTLNTFHGMVKYVDGSSELEKLLEKTDYEQVIAFNHPTISADVFENIEVLKELLGPEKFAQSVGLIAASRGCILVQAIGADSELPFTVDKAILFSPANGVGYFNFGDKISTALSILKKVTKGTPASYAFALLQFSSDYFMEQPGAMQMRFKSDLLTRVINGTPANETSEYFSIVNDWNKLLVDKRAKRLWMRIADGVIKKVLGKEHDFVVGIKGQTNLPPRYNFQQVPMSSTHCKYFTKGELHQRDSTDEVMLSVFLAKLFN